MNINTIELENEALAIGDNTAASKSSSGRPLNVSFIITSMPVGGQETLLVDLIRRLDRERFSPQLCCIKTPGPLGEILADEIPVHNDFLKSKFDLRVLPRLASAFRENQTDAVVTVGAGDKMFWGRLAARWATVPVIISAIHSTGWPDRVGWLNRQLNPITDAFIAVAKEHGRYLSEKEHFPADKVHVIPNGIDVERFQPHQHSRQQIRSQLNITDDAPVFRLVAELRPEKNHELFLGVAARVITEKPTARFLMVGDGPQREKLEELTRAKKIDDKVHFLGVRHDVPDVLAAIDGFLLTSHIEASPVSILEAMSVELPVVAVDVGSISESVQDQRSGYVTPSGDAPALTAAVVKLINSPEKARNMGYIGRRLVSTQSSVQSMVAGYEDLIEQIYLAKIK